MTNKYGLKLKNAIPVYGAAEYIKRVGKINPNEKISKEEDDTIGLYIAALAFYNLIAFSGAAIGVQKGLEFLLK
jgi:hypothetical protein